MQLLKCIVCGKDVPDGKNSQYCGNACEHKASRERNLIPKLCQGELFPYYTFLRTLKSYEIQELYRLEKNKMKHCRDWHKIKQKLVILNWVYREIKQQEIMDWNESDEIDAEIPAIDKYGE